MTGSGAHIVLVPEKVLPPPRARRRRGLRGHCDAALLITRLIPRPPARPNRPLGRAPTVPGGPARMSLAHGGRTMAARIVAGLMPPPRCRSLLRVRDSRPRPASRTRRPRRPPIPAGLLRGRSPIRGAPYPDIPSAQMGEFIGTKPGAGGGAVLIRSTSRRRRFPSSAAAMDAAAPSSTAATTSRRARRLPVTGETRPPFSTSTARRCPI